MEESGCNLICVTIPSIFTEEVRKIMKIPRKTMKIPKEIWLVFGLIFEPRTSLMQSRSATYLTMMFIELSSIWSELKWVVFICTNLLQWVCATLEFSRSSQEENSLFIHSFSASDFQKFLIIAFASGVKCLLSKGAVIILLSVGQVVKITDISGTIFAPTIRGLNTSHPNDVVRDAPWNISNL
jgi:hypothetical protein